mgnify:CR=1 FL=1
MAPSLLGSNVSFYCVFCMIKWEKYGGWQQGAILPTHSFYFYVVNNHVKYIVYKYSHTIVYIISCNEVKCFSHAMYIYTSHALFVNKSLKYIFPCYVINK